MNKVLLACPIFSLRRKKRAGDISLRYNFLLKAQQYLGYTLKTRFIDY